MESKRLKEKYYDYSNAVKRLKEVLNSEIINDYIYDAAIQRFEFTYELSWKLMKMYMTYNGIAEVNMPRETFKEAFAAGLIKDGDLWIEMLKDRNLTSHTYDEDLAKSIYKRVKDVYINIFEILRLRLEKEIL